MSDPYSYHRAALGSAAPPHLRRAAEDAAREAGVELGLGELHLRWWRLDRARPAVRHLGWVDREEPGVINLSVDAIRDTCTPAEVRAVVFHEARHLWQEKNTRYLGDRMRAERDANEFALRTSGVLAPIRDHWEY